jgi:hypothetical protein
VRWFVYAYLLSFIGVFGLVLLLHRKLVLQKSPIAYKRFIWFLAKKMLVKFVALALRIKKRKNTYKRRFIKIKKTVFGKIVVYEGLYTKRY